MNKKACDAHYCTALQTAVDKDSTTLDNLRHIITYLTCENYRTLISAIGIKGHEIHPD